MNNYTTQEMVNFLRTLGITFKIFIFESTAGAFKRPNIEEVKKVSSKNTMLKHSHADFDEDGKYVAYYKYDGLLENQLSASKQYRIHLEYNGGGKFPPIIGYEYIEKSIIDNTYELKFQELHKDEEGIYKHIFRTHKASTVNNTNNAFTRFPYNHIDIIYWNNNGGFQVFRISVSCQDLTGYLRIVKEYEGEAIKTPTKDITINDKTFYPWAHLIPAMQLYLTNNQMDLKLVPDENIPNFTKLQQEQPPQSPFKEEDFKSITSNYHYIVYGGSQATNIWWGINRKGTIIRIHSKRAKDEQWKGHFIYLLTGDIIKINGMIQRDYTHNNQSGEKRREALYWELFWGIYQEHDIRNIRFKLL